MCIQQYFRKLFSSFWCIARPRESSRTGMAKVGNFISQQRLEFRLGKPHQPMGQYRPSFLWRTSQPIHFFVHDHSAAPKTLLALPRPRQGLCIDGPQNGDDWCGWTFHKAGFLTLMDCKAMMPQDVNSATQSYVIFSRIIHVKNFEVSS